VNRVFSTSWASVSRRGASVQLIGRRFGRVQDVSL